MNCFYSAQGEYSCKETFVNKGDNTDSTTCDYDDMRNINIGYKGGTNCGEVCYMYGKANFCKYYAHYPGSTDSPCKCSPLYKKLSFEKDPFSISMIVSSGDSNIYSGTRLVGGGSVNEYNNVNMIECGSNIRKTKADGAWMSYKDDQNIENIFKKGTCILHFIDRAK